MTTKKKNQKNLDQLIDEFEEAVRENVREVDSTCDNYYLKEAAKDLARARAKLIKALTPPKKKKPTGPCGVVGNEPGRPTCDLTRGHKCFHSDGGYLFSGSR